MNQIPQLLAKEFALNLNNVENTISLIEDGNTIPFIARYRKEVTGNMSDEVLRDFDERLSYLKNLEQRKEEVIHLIEKQGKLTSGLAEKINACTILKDVEDLYLPFRPKKRTRATIAKEKGLEPLAEKIASLEYSDDQIRDIANSYIDSEKEVESVQNALDGACDIIAEQISENADFRKYIRSETYQHGVIVTSQIKDQTEEQKVFEMYYDYREPIKMIADHRILAINRGESKKILKVAVEAPIDSIVGYLSAQVCKTHSSELLRTTIQDAYKRLIAPSVERETRAVLSERADDSAITVFAKNLKSLLLSPPVKDKVIMGFDPAYRTGCKIAVISPVGKLLDFTTVYPTAPQNQTEAAKKTLIGMIEKHHVDVISIGNGTASRESEVFVADMIKELSRKVEYVIVNEAGASVYSASKLGTEEYPDLNVSIRGAVSIAQRLKDPLAELVKIDPKHIGVGQYQHDVDQKSLTEALEHVVENAVNSVGVDINSASPALLSHVSGITKKTAVALFEYVKEHGGIKNRKELLKVSGIGAKAFEQCAGFLRVSGGDCILDNTSVHPESYAATLRLIESANISLQDLGNENQTRAKETLEHLNIRQISDSLEIGTLTLKDIVEELKKPGRDPRDELVKVSFKSDIMEMKDLQPGMKLTGTVRNITHFGAFVDIGVHEDGLVHISQLSDRFVKDPFEVVSVGDIVNVTVLEVDQKKKRISLTMKS
ncbi:MAG: Tex family protein [Anaerofustis sp.]